MRHRTLAILLALVMPGLRGALCQAPGSIPLEHRIAGVLATREPALVAFRRELHQDPELSGEEVRTAARVAERLRALGFEVRTGIGGQGVVGLLKGGRPGPVVAFRADMDAVATPDPDPVEFRSRTPGVRHSCGHDIHTTLGIALAEGFSAVRAELPGSVLLLFQPAEERATGARAMLADGVFSLARPVAIYAVHTAPLEVGRIGTEPGPLLAGRDQVEVTLRGSGDLAAAADSAQAILRRAGTITRGQAQGDLPHDFVLAEAWPARGTGGAGRLVQGTLSIADPGARRRARAGIERALARLALPGVEVALRYRARATAGVSNDSALAVRGDARIRAMLGDSAVVRVGVVSPLFSEDFGSFQDEVPGVMYLLGVSNSARGWVGMPHSPGYVADEGAILVGASALAAVILDRLAPSP